MSKSNPQNVGAQAVREWAENKAAFKDAPFVQRKANGNFVQGRIPKTAVEAYEKATGNTYVTGTARPTETAPVEVVVRKRDKKGRVSNRKRSLTRAQVLEAAGLATNTKGRLSAATIAAAGVALSDEGTHETVEAPAEA